MMDREMPYTGRRNLRFVTVRRGCTHEDVRHCLQAAWIGYPFQKTPEHGWPMENCLELPG